MSIDYICRRCRCELTGLSPIEVVEAAYRLDGTDLEWLRGLGKAVRPLLDGDRGLLCYLIDAASEPAEQFARRVVFDVSPEDVELAEQLLAKNIRMTAAFHDVPPSLDASAVASYRAVGRGQVDDRILDAYSRLGVADFSAFRTVEPGPLSVAFVAGQRIERQFDAETIARWARVAAHVAAGRRLRITSATDFEAVVSTAGRIEHAVGEAASRAGRVALREAMERQEHARSPAGRRDDDRALAAWTPLVAGRWSLVDQFERSGLRYLVARPNEHGLAEPRTLAPRERTLAHLSALGKSNLLIAYELGIAETTVATHLGGVMKKLGATSRIELRRRLLELLA